MNDSVKLLQTLLKDGKVIPVIGAGVSASTANLPSWSKLVHFGFEFAKERNLNQDQILKGEKFLKKGKLLKSANFLNKLLAAPKYPFINFIKQHFENPEIVSRDLINSILDLSSNIIITTNYDTLLSSVNTYSHKTKFVHDEYQEIKSSIKNEEEIIIHIHGIHSRPETIILSEKDYKKLNENIGYKTLMQELLSNYHFLFIGCSKDGVMDDDFLPVFNFIKNYFSNVANQHFIFVQEKEISSGNHIPLLHECNIEAICYGSSYELLSSFINDLNPNFDKKQFKNLSYKKYFEDEIKRLAVITNNFSQNTAELDLFFDEAFNSKQDWDNKEKLNALKSVLDKYNLGLNDKKEKLLFTQNIITSIFKVSELEKKVELWNEFGDDPSKLKPLNFMSTAILAYDCLLKIPEEIINDIEKSDRWGLLHNGFYNGYLSNFIREIDYYKEKGVDLEDKFKHDRYLFENLKRIIQSLENFLKLDAVEFYSEIKIAQINSNLPNSFIALVTKSEIQIRSLDNIDKILANLNLNKNYLIPKITILDINSKKLIIAHNSHTCFYWNPEEDVYSTEFYSSTNVLKELIISKSNNSEYVLTIHESKKLINFNDSFEKINTINLSKSFLSVVAFNNKYIGLKAGDSMYKDVILFSINLKAEIVPSLSYSDLLNNCKEDKDLFNLIYKYEQSKDYFKYASLISVKKQKVIYYNNQEYIVLIASLTLSQESSIIFILQECNQKLKVLKLLHIIEVCFCMDYLINSKNELKLLFGNLDINNNQVMCSEIILDNNLQIVDSKSYNYLRNKYEVRDILSCSYIDEHNFLLSEEGKKIILLKNGNYSEYCFQRDEKIICFDVV